MGDKKTVELSLRQHEAMSLISHENKTIKYLLYGGAAGGGKSFLLATWLLFVARSFPETRWFIGREELKRLKESTLVTFFKAAKYFNLHEEFIFNGQDHTLRFKNNSQINLLDLKYLPSDPLYERYGSTEYTGGAMDEGGEVHFGAFDVLKTRIGRYNNEKWGLIPAKMLITANPKKNWLKTIFYDPWRSGTLLPEYAFVPAFAYENPFIDKGYLENLESISDPVAKSRLRDGNWDYADEKNQLIPFDKIRDLFTNQHVLSGEKFITADIARFGKDTTTIGTWSGFRLEDIVTLEKNSIPEAARQIRTIASARGIPMSRVLVDEDGVGGGVKDILSCKGFINNSRAVQVKGKTENYSNLKSQCAFMFSEKANNAGVYVNAPSENLRKKITEEVEQIRSETLDSDTKLSIISKDKVKDAIGRSPDYSDMIIMRMYFELPHNTEIKGWTFN